MGQRNALRITFEPREQILNPQNNDRQDLAFTGYLKVGDTVDVLDIDAQGNIISVLADNLTVQNILPGVAVILSAAVDTTLATVTPYLQVHNINSVQEAMDRLYRRKLTGPVDFVKIEAVLDQRLDSPIAGQAKYLIGNISFIRVGDKVDIISNEGTAINQANVVAVSPNADDTNNKASVTLDQSVDVSGLTNPYLVVTSIDLQKAIERNQEDIDKIDSPIENEDINDLNGICEGRLTCFEAVNLFVQKSSKPMIDGARMKLGTAGTRAAVNIGTYPAQNTALRFISMMLGTLGNEVRVQIVNAAGLTITITKSFSWTPGTLFGSSDYLIQINNNSGAATAKEIADALNAHAVARRLVQVLYGGDGSGVVAAVAATALTGGLDDGTKDYAELEQVFENKNVNTGYKFISFHIRPNDPYGNRLAKPPADVEELVIDYRKALVNI